MATTRTDASPQLARQVREQFVGHAQGALIPLAEAIRGALSESAVAAASVAERHTCRDLLERFDAVRVGWVEATTNAWRAALAASSQRRVRGDSATLELMGDDVFEQKILASRLAHAITERAGSEFNDLKLRVQRIENEEELPAEDVLRPESAAQLLVEQWISVGLTREGWLKVHEVIRQHMSERLLGAYQRGNAVLVAAGVLPEIEMAARVKRSTSKPVRESVAAGLESRRGRSSETLGLMSEPDQGMGMGSSGGVAEETRLVTAASPLARARLRASGVLGQLKRMLSDRVGGHPADSGSGPSPGLAAALAHDATRVLTMPATLYEGPVTGAESIAYDRVAVEQIAGELRQRSSEIKSRASTSAEKATIEIVALMFQSILAEDRIPPTVRVWFARLQMPVLRVALAEPEFFGTMEHPARQLIDRLGSCVMGFDTVEIGGSALENEIKRVVQVIEQYPETGRRVFQLVYDEFQKFLSRFLTEKGSTQRLVSVAQQVEQKETMAIQYTIEMRNMLNDIPVRDEIREFLFKVWAEVLAIVAVKHGPQHADTIVLKKSAADLVWAASAKPQRSDRARVIQDLPALLQRLRQGMTLLGLPVAVQEAHIKVLGDTLADAFQSKTESISQPLIEQLSERLAHLEDFVAEDPETDLPLDEQSIELLLGIDASTIEVVADDGQRSNEAMLSWALELQLGNWFTLDHNSRMSQVQYVWCSRRKQLHLFAMPDGKSFLIQLRRLASYLQSGLLLPAEEETLTVRATRDALAKLNANPERLLT